MSTFIGSLSKVALVWLACFYGFTAQAQNPPFLAFSDIVDGPSSGLGDGLGSGAIVTVWGFNLGVVQGNSTIEFCDSSNVCRPAAHVYYWKSADGTLPGGPANLAASHGMQELAFSIPDSAVGPGSIVVTTAQGSSQLEFTVRSGTILWVSENGGNSNPGTFNSPMRDLEDAINSGTSRIVYVKGGDYSYSGTSRVVWFGRNGATGTPQARSAMIPYPGTRTKVFSTSSGNTNGEVFATRVFGADYGRALVISKMDAWSTATQVNTVIETSEFGRAVANRLTDSPDNPNVCANGFQGAMQGNDLNANGAGKISGFAAYGNEIYDYGCKSGTSKFHHTTYFSIRSGDEGGNSDHQVEGVTVKYNYLHGNYAKNGIHFYDEDTGDDETCGDMISDLVISDNVVIDQGGSGISVQGDCWSIPNVHITDNILVRVGQESDVRNGDSNGSNTVGISIYGSMPTTFHIKNNLIWKWNPGNWQNSFYQKQSCLRVGGRTSQADLIFQNNICYTELGMPWVEQQHNSLNLAQVINSESRNNLWYSTTGATTPPSWDSTPLSVDPKLIVDEATGRVSVEENSPLINASIGPSRSTDIYGNEPLSVSGTLGPVELVGNVLRPKAPVLTLVAAN